MIPGVVIGATRILGAPAGWDIRRDGVCAGLPIRDMPPEKPGGVPTMLSVWQPTPDELQRLAAGAPVILAVCGVAHPPVMLSAGVAPPEAG